MCSGASPPQTLKHAVPKARRAWASPSGATDRVAFPAGTPALPYLPGAPGSSSVGAARVAQLRSRCGSLGLFPLPSASSLTTSPPLSHHVRTPGPLWEHSSSTPRRALGPAAWPGAGWLQPASLPCAPDAAFARGRVVRSCQLSMSRSPALLLLLRAPLDRIGQQCGACHWPGETVRALIGRARARGAPHSTVSERFETPHALLSVCGMGGGAREGVREEERCKCRDKKFPCARERVNCS